MKPQFNQPNGSVAIEVNKQSIARAFGIKQSEVIYAEVGKYLSNAYHILFEETYQTCWLVGNANGNIISWDTDGDYLSITTSIGVFGLEKASIHTSDNTNFIVEEPTTINTRQLIRNREAARSSNVVRFVTWNNQGNNSVVTYYGGDYGSRQRIADLTDWYLRMGADFVGSQEVFGVPELPDAAFAMYPYQTAFHSNSVWFQQSRRYGNLVMATRALANSTQTIYASPPSAEDSEYRSYIRTELNVNGTIVAVYCTHLGFPNSRQLAMIAELNTRLQTETATHIVLMGDWNTQTDSDFQPFINSGFTMINKNGELNTNNVGGTWYIDRIFHKGFSHQGDYGVFSPPISLGDHKPLYADLTL